jgi:subtilase family serine protease
VIAATLFAGFASTALAQSATPGGGKSVTIPISSTANALDAGERAHTNIQILASPGDFSGSPQFYGPPFAGLFYEDPASIACIYNLQPQVPGCNPNGVFLNPNGGRKALAIVDAYDDPNAYADLAAFSAQFGVGAINPTSFIVVFAPKGGATPGSCTTGTAPRPPVDPSGGWEVEEALDIEWAHAMAPEATLYLVEAQSNSYSDLLCAVTVASGLVQKAGGGEVSMSWGSGEFPGETTIDPVFKTPGVVYFASAGDSPGASYPSASPNVVSVGGTSVSRNPVTGAFIGENVWQDGGSGPSAFEPRPAYQNGISSIVGSHRGTPDIAADANPYTGVWVLDNFMPPRGCTPCWYIVGGTSVSAPMWAGIVNAAGSFSTSTNAELTKLYGDHSSDFNDIELGSCGPYMGYFATEGWDFCSGHGSPRSYSGK